MKISNNSLQNKSYSLEMMGFSASLPDLGIFFKNPLSLMKPVIIHPVTDDHVVLDEFSQTLINNVVDLDTNGVSSDVLVQGVKYLIAKAEKANVQNIGTVATYVDVARDKPINAINIVYGKFSTKPRTVAYQMDINMDLMNDIDELIRTRDHMAVKNRLRLKDEAAIRMGVSSSVVTTKHCPINALSSGVLLSPYARGGFSTIKKDYRGRALRKLFSMVSASTIVTVDAEGGGAVKTYARLKPDLDTLVVLSFSNVNSRFSIYQKYEKLLSKYHPRVKLIVLPYDFSSDDIYMYVHQILQDLENINVSRNDSLFMYTYYPGAMPLANYFKFHFAIIVKEESVKSVDVYRFRPFSGNDYLDAKFAAMDYLSKNQCKIATLAPKYDDIQKRYLVFSQHECFLDRVVPQTYLNKFSLTADHISRYLCVDFDDSTKLSVVCGRGHDINYSTFKSVPVADRINMSMLKFEDVMFFPNVEFESSLIGRYKGDEHSKTRIPKTSQYVYAVLNGKRYYYDYNDTRLSFDERRENMRLEGMTLLEGYSKPRWKLSLVAFRRSKVVNDYGYVDRDEFSSMVKIDNTIQIIEKEDAFSILDVGYCNEHGVVRDQGSVLSYNPHGFPILGSPNYNMSDGWYLKRSVRMYVPPENPMLRFNLIACNKPCVPISSWFKNKVYNGLDIFDMFDQLGSSF